MHGLLTVFRKELADHFSSRRFIVLLALVWLIGLSGIYVAGQSIREAVAGSEFVFLKLFTTSTGALPPFWLLIAVFFGPLIGLVLGFDAINREQSSGTMGLVLSQPIFRDSVINGKFLAGMSTIAFMFVSIVLIMSGLGLWMLGVPPSLEEALRIIAYTGITIIYIGFWMALAMLFSVYFKRIATSALAGIAVWMFFAFFMSMVAGVVADGMAPVDEQGSFESLLKHDQLERTVMMVSPTTLYSEAVHTILEPTLRSLWGAVMVAIPELGSLPFSQSLIQVWPHLVTIVSLTLACFAISYVRFMRQEIRAP